MDKNTGYYEQRMIKNAFHAHLMKQFPLSEIITSNATGWWIPLFRSL